MDRCRSRSFPLRRSLPLSLSLPLALAACAPAPQAPTPPVDAAQAARREALHRAGPAAPLVLHPVMVLSRASAEVAEVLGLVLERRGGSAMVVAPTPFEPGEAPWSEVPALLGAHVRAQPEPAAFHLYAQFLGDPRQGPTEVRFAVVDAAGDLVWADRQVPGDAAFDRTAGRDRDPLGCASLVADRLFALADWRPVAGAPEGAFAERFRARSGVPDPKELAAMRARAAALGRSLAQADFAVLPTVSLPADAASAARIAALAQQQLGCRQAVAVERAALALRPSSNEQRRLYDLVAAARAALQAQPIDAAYALVCDLGLDPDGGHGFVHTVVLSRAGELVVADFQNDQSPSFQRRPPRQLADAEQLAVARLAEVLR